MSFSVLSALLLLGGCGRQVEDVPVRLVGVGSDPEDIGPSPVPYGGVAEIDRVDIAGGGLSLAHFGLGSFDEVGPAMVDFAPPYKAIVAFSYFFDQKLPAADTLSFVAPVPPKRVGSCYTAFNPEGPIGSFNTVDVGDAMDFTTEDGSSRIHMARSPVDYPPDPHNVFIYYSTVEEYAPHSKGFHTVVDPVDPTQMGTANWKTPNWPSGQSMIFSFPGGLTQSFDPVSSIPRPSSSVDHDEIPIPNDLGGVLVKWSGPRYDAEGVAVQTEGDHTQCLEFYGDGRTTAPAVPADCDTPPDLPHNEAAYNTFRGQVYSGPWDATDGKLTFEWTPGTGEQVALAIRFMAPIDPTDPNFVVAMNGDRPATACEQNSSVTTLDPSLSAGLCCQVGDEAIWVADSPTCDAEDGTSASSTACDGANHLPAPIQGDPFSRMVEVSCLLDDSAGTFTLDQSILGDALTYVGSHPAGGAIFFFSRGTETETNVPAAKDPYDQKHDISPVKIVSRDVRIGRLHWDGPETLAPVATEDGTAARGRFPLPHPVPVPGKALRGGAR